MLKDELRRQQHREADREMEQGRARRHVWQDFEWKYDFLNVIDVGEDEARRSVEALGEEPVDHQSDEEHNGEIGLALLTADRPSHLEHDGENEGVYGEHQQWIEERPSKAQYRTAITAQHLALRQLQNHLTVVPQACEQRIGG